MTTVITVQGPDGGPGPASREAGPVDVASMTADDHDAVAAMFSRCSAATLRRRFHGITDGMAYLNGQLKASEVVLLAKRGTSCVGLGVLAADDPGPWDLGVLVEDAWQLCGVGTRLVTALVAEARRRQVTVIRADLLAENAFAVGLLRRIGPIAARADHAKITVDVRLAPDAAARPRRGSG